MKRRDFLAGLGMAAGAIAFRNALPVDLTWFAPKDVIPHAGKATPEWLAAEALAALEQHLEGMKTLTLEPMTHLSAGVHMLGVDVNLPDEELERPLDELRAMYISPAMASLPPPQYMLPDASTQVCGLVAPCAERKVWHRSALAPLMDSRCRAI